MAPCPTVTILGLLPFAGLVLAVAAARTLTADHAASLLGGLVAWGVTTTGLVELLSAAGALSQGPLTIAWLLIDVALAIVVVQRRARAGWRPSLPALSIGERFVLAVVVVLLALELVVCLLSPPTTWDSMTYHLPRVMHWLQDHSLRHYPTSIDRQLWMGPWTEYVITQVHGIAGWDVFDNLVQWTAGLMSVGVVWLLALELGLGRRAAWLTIAAFVTLPMAVVQGTSTQTDLATTLWVLTFVTAALRDARKPTLVGALVCGLAAGLAVLTKGSAFVFAAPFAAMWLVLRVRRMPRRATVGALTAAGLAAVAIVTPFMVSNYRSWHDPLGPPSSVAITNSTSHGPTSIVSTALRDTATVTSTPSAALNDKTTRAAAAVIRAIGADPSDPATTFGGNEFAVQFFRDEDYASAPMHVALVVLGLLWLVVTVRRAARPLLVYAAIWVVTAVLFAALIRWSYWNNRVELALMALAMPFAALALDRLPRIAPYLLVALLGVSAFGWLLLDDARPLTGSGSVLTTSRDAAYFEKRPDLRQPYDEAATAVTARRARSIGLVLGLDDWEYPLWVLIHEKDPNARIFDARAHDWHGYGRTPIADVIVCTDLSAAECQARPGWTITVNGAARVLART